ncbi:hypothetical protein KFU94_08300 [Chloroflexi bacterium TSY]|nr:hypothetical protein [Chloroflexi bacterium TSY]
MSTKNFEVEIRFCVDQVEEAYQLVPFLEQSLGESFHWSTMIIGRTIFNAGKLLRVGTIPTAVSERTFLGYKDPDLGTFANIRAEWGEEITEGTAGSEILQKVGINSSFATAHEVLAALKAVGHEPFMSFTGVDRLGYYEPLRIHTKATLCPKILSDRVLIELELEAHSLEEAKAAETELQEIATRYAIADRLIRDEPPTLLFRHTFG